MKKAWYLRDFIFVKPQNCKSKSKIRKISPQSNIWVLGGFKNEKKKPLYATLAKREDRNLLPSVVDIHHWHFNLCFQYLRMCQACISYAKCAILKNQSLTRRKFFVFLYAFKYKIVVWKRFQVDVSDFFSVTRKSHVSAYCCVSSQWHFFSSM